MFNKKIVLVTGILILAVGAAAFLAGRMLNRGIEPIISDGSLGGPRFTFSSSNNITPAAELPANPSEVTGLYAEMKDHTMLIQAVSFDPGIGAILGDSVDINSASKVEILITANTTIYHDTTQVSLSAADGNAAIQQTVEESTLEELAPPTMITVWGRKSGDRIIATVLLFSNSLNIQKP
jgi:hypothetical protein